MAGSKLPQRVDRRIALGLEVKGTVEIAIRSVDESRLALLGLLDAVAIDYQGAKHVAVALQSEALRLVATALSVRAASAQLQVLSMLAADADAGAL